MMINEFDEVVVVPSMSSILVDIKNDIKEFIAKIDRFDYRIIRVAKFNYVVKNVIKPHDYDDASNKK